MDLLESGLIMQASASTAPHPNLARGTIVRLTKLAEVRPGLIDVGYWFEGVLQRDVREGKSIDMLRCARAPRGDERDPYEGTGLFNTSTVTELINEEWNGVCDSWTVTTRNSTWRLDVLPNQVP